MPCGSPRKNMIADESKFPKELARMILTRGRELVFSPDRIMRRAKPTPPETAKRTLRAVDSSAGKAGIA